MEDQKHKLIGVIMEDNKTAGCRKVYISRSDPIHPIHLHLFSQVLLNSPVKYKEFKKYIKRVNKEVPIKISPMDICIRLLSGNQYLPDFLKSTDLETRYYWIGNIYTSLIPASTKKELAAHFTPPAIARYVIKRLENFGFDVTNARILDPASGGAAFLTPLATIIIEKLKGLRRSDIDIGLHILNHISGIEIDNNLAKLSGLILTDFLSKKLPAFKDDLFPIILNENTLNVFGRESQYDAIVSNPPYGVIRNPAASILERFSDSLTDKHVNKYVLFIRLSISWVRPGGFLALIVPTSFIAGPYFRNLRKSILEDAHVLAIDLIEKRDGFFVDVLQDACILFLRRKNGSGLETHATCKVLDEFGICRALGQIDIPSEPSERPWVLPSELKPNIPTNDFFSESYATLADYGYGVRAGYFVWNRQKKRCREGKSPRKNEYPLIWAHCVKAGKPCTLATHRIHGKQELITLIKFDKPSETLISEQSIILQRTTNRNQNRRLIAGYITKNMINKYGSVISENHTIVVYPLHNIEQKINLRMMCRLLNSKPVDIRYRQISGTVSVSVKLLKEMPFPPPVLIKNRLRENLGAEEFDELVETCYHEVARLKR